MRNFQATHPHFLRRRQRIEKKSGIAFETVADKMENVYGNIVLIVEAIMAFGFFSFPLFFRIATKL